MGENAIALSAELFRRIIGASSAAASARAALDQRKTPRATIDLRVQILPFSDCFGCDCPLLPLRNLSAGGLGFLNENLIPLGEQFGMVLHEPSGRPLVVLCTVSYWQPLAQKLYAIGAKFTRILRQGEIDLPIMLNEQLASPAIAS